MLATKVMFEIYRDPAYGGRLEVVYFTELGEHERDGAIARAMAGEHVYDGYLNGWKVEEAKAAIARLLDDLNRGAPADPAEIARRLAPFAA